MNDTMGLLACPDCSRKSTVAFIMVLVQGGKGKLIGFAVCTWCRQRGDARSLRGTIGIDLVTMQSAVDNGLPAVQIS